MSVDSVKTAIATRDNGDQPTVFEAIERQLPEIRRALPSHMDADRLTRIALTIVRKTPLLASCSMPSLLGALMTSAQVGLEPGPLGHCWLIPRRNKKTGNWECHWEIGYTGIQELARRSGLIGSIEARPVFEADEFDFEHGSQPFLRHRPSLSAERGERIAFYAYVEVLNARDTFRVMPLHEVERIRDQYGGGGDSGPWVTDFDAMAAKTVVRAMRNYLPQSPVMAQALNADGTVRTELSADALDVPRSFEAEPAPHSELTTELSSSSGGGSVVESGTGVPAGDDDGPRGSDPPGIIVFPSSAEIDEASHAQLGKWLEDFGIDCEGRSSDDRRVALHAAEPFDVDDHAEEKVVEVEES